MGRYWSDRPHDDLVLGGWKLGGVISAMAVISTGWRDWVVAGICSSNHDGDDVCARTDESDISEWVVSEPSVRPSVCQTRQLWQNERIFCPYIYTIRKNDYRGFPTRRMVGGERPLQSEILVQTDPIRAKTRIFNQYSPVTPSENKFNWKSTTRLPTSQDEQHTSVSYTHLTLPTNREV